MKEAILISACLLGVRCRYDGKSVPQDAVCRLAEKYQLIPVCPEQLGGLPTPRASAERRNGGVFTNVGGDVTEAYRRGAEEALRLARIFGCKRAVLKERSPSCGSGTIYDGSFTGRLTPGDGVTAALLKENDIAVYGESALEALLSEA